MPLDKIKNNKAFSLAKHLENEEGSYISYSYHLLRVFALVSYFHLTCDFEKSSKFFISKQNFDHTAGPVLVKFEINLSVCLSNNLYNAN